VFRWSCGCSHVVGISVDGWRRIWVTWGWFTVRAIVGFWYLLVVLTIRQVWGFFGGCGGFSTQIRWLVWSWLCSGEIRLMWWWVIGVELRCWLWVEVIRWCCGCEVLKCWRAGYVAQCLVHVVRVWFSLIFDSLTVFKSVEICKFFLYLVELYRTSINCLETVCKLGLICLVPFLPVSTNFWLKELLFGFWSTEHFLFEFGT
jgi:hypothetical protein